MTQTPGDVGMHDLRLFGRSASRARELVVPPPPPPLKSQGAGLSRWAPSKEPPAS